MILADLSKFRFSAARFSNSVDKWVTLPDLEGSLESVESYKVTDFIIVVLLRILVVLYIQLQPLKAGLLQST